MKYREGDCVEHRVKGDWGRGYVLNVIGEERIQIFFEYADEVKTFVLGNTKLKKLHHDSHAKNKWLDEVRRYAKFPWPTTNAPISIHGLGDVFSYQEGLLSYVGYQVGNEGKPRKVRQSILDWVFHNRLPRVKSESYMLEWGDPETSARLKKMANALAAFTRNEKRKTHADYTMAIRDREIDLKYLRDKYYVGQFYFEWPPSKNL